MRRLPVILLWLMIWACSTRPPAPNKFSDPQLIKINNLKDRRFTDSLLVLLKAENPLYRRETALSFGSVQDSMASKSLGTALLEDPDARVRRNAAFALGQTGGVQSVNALIPALQDKDREVVREVLEAVGKTADKMDISALREFQTSDTLLQEGQAWGFYHLALRRKSDSIVTRKVSEFLLSSNSYQTRLAAASYFGRSQKLEGKGFEENLIRAALQDTRPEVRMAAVSGFRHLGLSKAWPALENMYRTEKDYRVRVNAVRACQNFPLPETRGIVFRALNDPSEMVAVAASEVIRNQSAQYPHKNISEEVWIKRSPQIMANLYAALLGAIPSDGTIEEIIKLYASGDDYTNAAMLSALGEAKSPLNKKALEFIAHELNKDTNAKVVLTSAIGAVVSIDKKAGKEISKWDFLKIYERAIAQGDVAVIGIVSSALMDKSLPYKEQIKDISFLYTAKSKLKLPKDIESLQVLERAIAFLEGKERPAPLKNEFNHAISWDSVKAIPANQRAEIKTTKGSIIVRLLVEEAPGSVANFVELVNKKYFDGKFVHRVVPNFVIQTGCNRGDGYGSEDYSIRSEFSLRRYTTGSVGMASAGKDTEGTQWFITHSPTPHLDGKYTIFAVVERGMETVDRLEVGDKIVGVKLLQMTNSMITSIFSRT